MEIDSLVSENELCSNSSSRGLLEQGVSDFCPSFQLLGCGEQFRIGDRIFTIDIVANICLYSGLRPSKKQSHFTPPHAPVRFCWGTLSWISEPVGIDAHWTQPYSLLFPSWGNKSPCLRCQRSSQHYSVHPTSWGHHPGWHPYPNTSPGLKGILAMIWRHRAKMTVIPTGVAKHGHVPLPWAVGHCVFGLFIFKGGQIDFYPKASSSLPWLATLPGTLAWFECHALYSLCPTELFPPDDGGPPKGPLGSHWPFCCLCLPQPQLLYCEWLHLQSGLWFVSSSPFGSPSESTIKPHIHSTTS